jgi:SAM-dependent methyltransferase
MSTKAMSAMNVNARGTNTEHLHFDVLRSREEVDAAKDELCRRGWVDFGSPLGRSLPAAALRRLLGRCNLTPDPIKSWDVLRALEAVMQSTAPELPILDMGSVACPMLPCLRGLGYGNLHGIDLDPCVSQMPFAQEIDYRITDMNATPWSDGTFAAITAISVIEHGFDQGALLDEVARLLRPGGVFIFSTDYWPEKISTDGVHLFGLDWRIFSAEEIESLLAAGRERDLHPVGDPGMVLRTPLAVGPGRRPVSYDGRDYTFLYGAFVRGRGESSRGRGEPTSG